MKNQVNENQYRNKVFNYRIKNGRIFINKNMKFNSYKFNKKN